jgi:hypothetical protein
MTTETVLGLAALAIVASAGIFTYIVVAARRKKAKRQLQTLLGTVYPSANRKTK